MLEGINSIIIYWEITLYIFSGDMALCSHIKYLHETFQYFGNRFLSINQALLDQLDNPNLSCLTLLFTDSSTHAMATLVKSTSDLPTLSIRIIMQGKVNFTWWSHRHPLALVQPKPKPLLGSTLTNIKLQFLLSLPVAIVSLGYNSFRPVLAAAFLALG